MMDSCLRQYAEKKLRDDGFAISRGPSGWYWIPIREDTHFPDSLKGVRFSELNAAIEALCRAILPPGAVNLVDARNECFINHTSENQARFSRALEEAVHEYERAASPPAPPLDPTVVVKELRRILIAILKFQNGEAHATSSSSPT